MITGHQVFLSDKVTLFLALCTAELFDWRNLCRRLSTSRSSTAAALIETPHSMNVSVAQQTKRWIPYCISWTWAGFSWRVIILLKPAPTRTAFLSVTKRTSTIWLRQAMSAWTYFASCLPSSTSSSSCIAAPVSTAAVAAGKVITISWRRQVWAATRWCGTGALAAAAAAAVLGVRNTTQRANSARRSAAAHPTGSGHGRCQRSTSTTTTTTFQTACVRFVDVVAAERAPRPKPLGGVGGSLAANGIGSGRWNVVSSDDGCSVCGDLVYCV